jgi:hypothetical protein
MLIVQSVAAENDALAELLPQLARKHGLDAFTARQRLIGRGPNLLARGPREQQEQIAALLAETDLTCWVIAPSRPRFAPARIRGLAIREEAVVFNTGERSVTLARESRVLAVLADLSGRAAAKNLKHLMAQKIYSGVAQARPIGDDGLYRAVLRAQPVLDLYLLDGAGRPQGALRAFPGRFDPAGLGDRATLSGAGNLERVLQLAREYAGDFTLSLDFGLTNLPGCRLKQAEDGPRWQQDNLIALTRYGWLLSDLRAAGPVRASSPQPTAAQADSPLLAAVAAGCPELAAELRDEPAEKPAPQTATADPGLPTPPSATGKHGRSARKALFGFSLAGGGGLFLAAGGARLLEPLLRQGIRTGLLPALVTAGFLWGGFHFLRLKRLVENTPTSKTRSLAMGLVEIQGRALRKYALVSPMSQMPCVYYRVRRYRRDNRQSWRQTSCSDSGHVPFYLQDETGMVTIDPRGASVAARNRQQGFGGQINMLLESSGHADRDEKWVEETVPEGTSLYVLGQATENRAGRPTLRQRLHKALRELKRDPQALRRYDRDGDGRISEQEWEQARAQVEEQLLHKSLTDDSATLRQGERVVIARPRQRSLPFVIAETPSEAHLLRNYALLMPPLFLGALLAAGWTIFTLVKYLRTF